MYNELQGPPAKSGLELRQLILPRRPPDGLTNERKGLKTPRS